MKLIILLIGILLCGCITNEINSSECLKACEIFFESKYATDPYVFRNGDVCECRMEWASTSNKYFGKRVTDTRLLGYVNPSNYSDYTCTNELIGSLSCPNK